MVQKPDNSFPSDVKVKNACDCTFIPPNVYIARVVEERRPKFASLIYFLIKSSSYK
jgi:hypothetical protein